MPVLSNRHLWTHLDCLLYRNVVSASNKGVVMFYFNPRQFMGTSTKAQRGWENTDSSLQIQIRLFIWQLFTFQGLMQWNVMTGLTMCRESGAGQPPSRFTNQSGCALITSQSDRYQWTSHLPKSDQLKSAFSSSPLLDVQWLRTARVALNNDYVIISP